VLGDETGLGASGNKTVVQGVQAGVAWAKTQGYNFNYVVGDTQTSPAGALSAAQKLVEQNHVFAVVANSSLTFAAANYLKQHNVPVVGVAEDASEWQVDPNMFSVYGAIHTNLVTTTVGQFFKMEGSTSVGSLGYGISPASAEAAKGAGVSAETVGLKAGYVNGNFPFGSTNVAPIALAMKAAGVDGFTASVDPNTGFALITALRQNGVDLKAALLPTGYGGDLQQAGPGAIQEGQNVYFGNGYEPIEMNTPATQQFATFLKQVGVTGDPTYSEYNGYASMILLVQGLQAAGSKPTQASLIQSLSGIHSFDAGGLFGNHPVDINNRTDYAGACQWITKLQGQTFKLVSGADPICGTVIQGRTVSPS
jgi:branched-chain amino acid transport system substrate-binding protein